MEKIVDSLRLPFLHVGIDISFNPVQHFYYHSGCYTLERKLKKKNF